MDNDLIESIIVKFVKLGIPETTEDDSPQARHPRVECDWLDSLANVKRWHLNGVPIADEDAEDLYAAHIVRLFLSLDFTGMVWTPRDKWSAAIMREGEDILYFEAETQMLAVDAALTELTKND